MPAQSAKTTAKARASNVAQRAGAEAPSGGSRRQILDTAARLLRTHGYHGATLRDIAEAVGIRKASIYHHFASKDEIVETVVKDGVNFVHAAVTKALSDLPASASARARLSAGVRAHLLALLEHSDYTSASIKVFSQVPRRVAARVRRVRRRYENVLARDLRRPQGAGCAIKEPIGGHRPPDAAWRHELVVRMVPIRPLFH